MVRQSNAHDRRRAAADEHGGIAGDGQQIAPVDAEIRRSVAGSSMPSGPTHHRSSFAPIHPQSADGPDCCDDELARIDVGVERLPGTVAESGPTGCSTSTTNGTLPTSDSVRRVTETEIRLGRRRWTSGGAARVPSIVQITPSGAMTVSAARRLAEVDVEREWLAASGSTVRLASTGLTTVRPGGPDRRNGSTAAERGESDRGPEPQFGGLDRAHLGGAVVQQICAGGRFGDTDVLAAGLGIDAGERPAAVSVDEHDTARRPMDEPAGGPRTTTRRRPASRRS